MTHGSSMGHWNMSFKAKNVKCDKEIKRSIRICRSKSNDGKWDNTKSKDRKCDTEIRSHIKYFVKNQRTDNVTHNSMAHSNIFKIMGRKM